MCSVCYAQRIGLNSVKVKSSELCDNHYRDWVDEKMMGEYDYA